MPLVINTNLASLNAQRNLAYNSAQLTKTFERLSSGYRINRAADDAAGLQISENLRSQIRGIDAAANNAQDGINLLSVAEGGVTTINDNLQRMRELLVQAANDTNGTSQIDAIENEIIARMAEIDRVAGSTKFNGMEVIGANTPGDLFLQIGPGGTSVDTVNIGTNANVLGSMTAMDLALPLVGSVTLLSQGDTNTNARTMLGAIDTALASVGERLAAIGVNQNRLHSALSNLEITRENFSASESRIRNADIAKEAATLSKYQILQQAAVSILSQANQTPNLALSLIGR